MKVANNLVRLNDGQKVCSEGLSINRGDFEFRILQVLVTIILNILFLTKLRVASFSCILLTSSLSL